jgi:hypothetical protein
LVGLRGADRAASSECTWASASGAKSSGDLSIRASGVPYLARSAATPCLGRSDGQVDIVQIHGLHASAVLGRAVIARPPVGESPSSSSRIGCWDFGGKLEHDCFAGIEGVDAAGDESLADVLGGRCRLA